MRNLSLVYRKIFSTGLKPAKRNMFNFVKYICE